MRIGRVIGKVTLSKQHASLHGARFRAVVPLSLANLTGESAELAEPLIAYDELGAAEGSLIGLSESREAAQPFYPDEKPIDAYNAAILDAVDVKPVRRAN